MIKGTTYIGVQRLMTLRKEKLAKAEKLAKHYGLTYMKHITLYAKLNAMGLYWFPSDRMWKKLGGD